MFKVFNLFFDFGDGQSLTQEIGIQNSPGNKRSQESNLHLRIQSAASGTDDRLRMLCPPPVNGSVVEGHVDHRQQPKNA